MAKVVAPKKAALAEAEGEYSALMSGLAAKKAQLAEVEKRLEALNTKLGQMQVGGDGRWRAVGGLVCVGSCDYCFTSSMIAGGLLVDKGSGCCNA